MIQRFIHDALTAGFTEIEADPEIIDDVFGEDSLCLDAAEIAIIKQYIAENKPNVIHGYPKEDSKYPLLAITLGAEGEKTHFMGDDAGIISDVLDEDFGADILSSIWAHQYPIHVYDLHPNATSYVYELAKAILQTAGPFFDGKGLQNVHISGMDLAPDPRYAPAHLFVRQLKFECEREQLRVNRSSKLGKAFKVQGIHVDKSGSTGEVGVPTNVTVFGLGTGNE